MCELQISSSTLYYCFSTIAQVLAATSALSAIFIQVKINEIKKFLIGTGKVMLNRIDFGEEVYRELDPTNKLRLRDYFDKEDIIGIEEILKIFVDKEKTKGIRQEDHPTGFQGVHEKFTKQKKIISTLKNLMKVAIIFSLMTIIYSILVLGLTDFIQKYLYLNLIIIFVGLVLLIISLLKTYKAIKKALE